MAIQDKYVTLAHGAGGSLSRELVSEMMLSEYGNDILNELHDGVRLNLSSSLAFTTDSYVVKPLFFPGGNIGKLAICGTVNDLAMTGAVPRYLSASFILEEGFPIETLKNIIRAMHQTAEEAQVQIVTGDTKVVEKGSADGIYINTAGLGEVIPGTNISPKNVRAGMKVILSGYLGDHGVAILSGRHGLSIPDSLKSDCAPLGEMIKTVLEAAPHTAVLRDPTRGGLAAVLNEIVEQSRCSICINEDALPICSEVQGMCDLLGFDVLELANEGKCVAIVPAEETEAALDAMHKNPYGRDACIIGEAVPMKTFPQVILHTKVGGMRLVTMPMGNLVPRIC